MKTTKEMIEFMQAYEDGKKVEKIARNFQEAYDKNLWHIVGEDEIFNFEDYEYRIAEEKQEQKQEVCPIAIIKSNDMCDCKNKKNGCIITNSTYYLPTIMDYNECKYKEKQETFFDKYKKGTFYVGWEYIYTRLSGVELDIKGQQWANYWLASRIMAYEIEKINEGWKINWTDKEYKFFIYYDYNYKKYLTLGNGNVNFTLKDFYIQTEKKAEEIKKILSNYPFLDGTKKNILDMYFGVNNV